MLPSWLRRGLPRSLRRQFAAVLGGLVSLVVAGSLVAVYALRVSAERTRELAGERLSRLQDAQDLAEQAVLIERAAGELMAARSPDELRDRAAGMESKLDRLDELVSRLGAGTAETEVLALHQSAQLFRNGTHILAKLRREASQADATFTRAIEDRVALLLETPDPEAHALATLLHGLRHEERRDRIEDARRRFLAHAGRARRLPPVLVDDLEVLRGPAPAEGEVPPGDLFAERAWLARQAEVLGRLQRTIEAQTMALVESAQRLSVRLTDEYRGEVAALARRSTANGRWVLVLMAGNLVLAWLVFRDLLGKQVLARLQQVSLHLREGEAGTQRPRVPVEGSDEIAEMARAVERLLADRHRLIEANRELEAFSYSVSHDLRAPLRHVDGFAQLLRERTGGALDPQARHYLDAIAQAGNRMGAHIDALLAFLRMRHAELSPGPVDLGALVREVVAELAPEAAGRAVEWRIGELPPVVGDARMLRIAFAALLSNALKFTRARARPEIEVSRDPTAVDGTPVIFVRDNGVGFDMRHAEKLFRVFHRLHHGDEFGGLGVGLAAVRRIVERHGGKAWAESAPGKGATFFVALPRAP